MPVAAIGLCSLPAFIPGITGARAPATSPALRGTAESSSTSTFGAAYGAGLALTVLGAAAVKRVSARKALRRELAVAYEESGIDLLDNGKFAQGLPGAIIKQYQPITILHLRLELRVTDWTGGLTRPLHETAWNCRELMLLYVLNCMCIIWNWRSILFHFLTA